MFGGNSIVFYDHGEVEERILSRWSDLRHFLQSRKLDMRFVTLPDEVHILVYDKNSEYDVYAEVNSAANMFVSTLQGHLDEVIKGNAIVIQEDALLNLET
jgi:predicted lipid carrier protein YhbT